MPLLKKWIGKVFGFEAEINLLRMQVDELSRDPVFGIWTRNAFLHFCQVMPRSLRVVTFLDLDNLHKLNEEYGYDEINRRIKTLFSIPFRRSDVVARWFSGDEIVILFDADQDFALRKIAQLEEEARLQGMSFHYQIGIWDVGKDPIEKVVNELADQVMAQKAWTKQQLAQKSR